MYEIFLLTASYIFLLMFCVWVVAWKIKNPALIDVFWPLGLGSVGLIYIFSVSINLRLACIAFLLSVWSLRLSIHLFSSRISRGLIDKRYLVLSQDWKISRWFVYLLHYEFQGLLIFIMTSVFYFSILSNRGVLSEIEWVGLFFCSIGIVGESIADMQLYNFKNNFPGEICNIGLWRYSRHPNYFFDWLTWCGFALFGLNGTYGWLSFASPILLFFIMNLVTGPMTEKQSIQSKGDAYLKYQNETSPFFLWFKLKN
jgi:steroid 5-alpha reductase family enzyme